MPRLISQTVDIGRDAYERQVTMTRHVTGDGRTMWRIDSNPVSQRDDGERMDGLTDENIRQMVQALDVVRRS
jgi:hypothetical protein